MSGHLVGSPAFKAGGTGDPRPAGSIPVHLRQKSSAPKEFGATRVRRHQSSAPPEPPQPPRSRLAGMKKLILLVMLVALGVVAAKKVRSA